MNWGYNVVEPGIMTDGRNIVRWQWWCLAILSTVFACLVFFVQIPVEIYAGNRDEFTFALPSLIALFAPWAFGIIATVTIVTLVQPRRVLPWYAAALAAIAVAIWVQGSFLVHDFGLLDGKSWSIRVPQWRSIAEHTGIAVIAALLLIFARKRPKAASLVLLGLIVAAASTSLPAIVSEDTKPTTESRDFSSFYSFSPDKNVLVVLLDSMQSDIFREAASENPEVAQSLDGFIYYPDTTGVSSSTYLAVPTIHSGREYQIDSSIQEHYRRSVVEGSFVDRLDDAGYQSSMVGPLLGICPQRADLCAGVREILYGSDGARRSDASTLLNLSLLRIAPMFLKKTVYNNGLWRISLEKKASFRSDQAAAVSNELLAELASNLKVDAKAPTVKFLHLMNTHLPVVFTEKCEFLAETIQLNRKSFKAQTNCALQHFAYLIRALKEKGIYNRTAIVLLSDHGSHGGWPHSKVEGNRVIRSNLIGVANPTLAVKPIGSTGPLRTDPKLASLTDVAATACDLSSDCTMPNGRSVISSGEDPQRVRRFLSYTWAAGMKGNDTLSDIVPYEVHGSLFDAGNWRRLPNELDLDETINFAKGGNSRAFTGEGWAFQAEDWGSRINDAKADLLFELKDTDRKDLSLRLAVRRLAKSDVQTSEALVVVNGKRIGHIALNSTSSDQELMFDIPAATLAKSHLVEISFEADKPMPGPDPSLGIGVRWMKLEARSASPASNVIPN